MYDMKPMAESLASQGRYGDSMLVHMNPIEVAGLRAAAQKMGGDLTTNPQTGQPEAFLPFLLGMGLQGLGMSALGAGIATGIGTAAITGDLGKGALAGLGAFGGAGIGEGLGAASVTQTPLSAGESFASASQAANAAALPPVSPTMVTPTVTDVGLGTGGFGGTTLPGGGMVSPTSFPAGTTPSLSASTGGFSTPPGIENTALQMPSFQTTIGGNVSSPSLMGGLENVMSGGAEGTAAREAFMGKVGGGSGLLKYTAAGIAPYAFEQPGLEGMNKQTSLIRPYDYDTSTREFTARTPYAAPGPEYESIQTMAQGGLTGYKEGNMLRGQGDGMSDEIQASIGGEQDVLLSDGEYVVPADAVAMLGNGSTDAGANRLDEMIARLRMKKYGRDKQPPEMKAEKVMPV
jgi:hypothetical protein